ncbi:hypothetical protein SBDP1_480028 [Syntrophobacter sp. SbD1]|nr:hypothetical protein SBDP1_480028 [Syntrophobacter sp. SbD1]
MSITPVKAVETNATEVPQNASAPKAASSAGNSSSKAQELAKLKMLANEHIPVSQIALQLNMSVSAVTQQAAAAGINLNAGTPAAAVANPAVGNNVNTTA